MLVVPLYGTRLDKAIKNSASDSLYSSFYQFLVLFSFMGLLVGFVFSFFTLFLHLLHIFLLILFGVSFLQAAGL